MDNGDQLERWAAIAQTITIGAAVIAGVAWVLTLVFDHPAKWTQTVGGIAIGVTFVGGIVMGLLYVARRARQT